MGIENVKKSYSQKQWEAREEHYVEELQKLELPDDPTTRDVLKINSRLDNLSTEAAIEFAYVSNQFEYYKKMIKIQEEGSYLTLKEQELEDRRNGGDSKAKLTADEIKSLVTNYLNNTPYNGTSKSIYDIYLCYMQRFGFIDRVVRTLNEKRQSLVTINAMLKLESLSGGNVTDDDDNKKKKSIAQRVKDGEFDDDVTESNDEEHEDEE